MRIHLDKGKSSVSLEARLDNESEVLEERHHVVGCSIRRQVSHVACGLPIRGLAQHHVVAAHAMSRELVVSERRRWRHAHSLHRLLLSNGWLALLVGPIASDGPGAQPFAVHGAQRLFSLGPIAEGYKAVTTSASSLHIPHDASFRDGAEGRECLCENFVVDLVGEIADEDVKVARSVFLARSVGLVRPVDSNFL